MMLFKATNWHVLKPLQSSNVSVYTYNPSITSYANRSRRSLDLSTSSLTSPPVAASLQKAIKPVISSKQYGNEELLSRLVAEAAMIVMPSKFVDLIFLFLIRHLISYRGTDPPTLMSIMSEW
jgi:hypothetical protein